MDAGFWGGVALVLVGAIFGGLIRALVHLYLRFEESKGIASALKAEIDAIFRIIEFRAFITKADDIIQRLQNPSHLMDLNDIFEIPIAQDYFSVFNSVSGKIGLIGDLSGPVVRFYVLMKSLIDEIQGLARFHENILRGLIGFDVQNRRTFGAVLLQVTQGMRALFDTMRDEGTAASKGLGILANVSFRKWIWSRCQ